MSIVNEVIALRTRNGKSKLARTGANPAKVRAERIAAVFSDLATVLEGTAQPSKNRPAAQLVNIARQYEAMTDEQKTACGEELAAAVIRFVDERTAEAESLAQQTERKEKGKSMLSGLLDNLLK